MRQLPLAHIFFNPSSEPPTPPIRTEPASLRNPPVGTKKSVFCAPTFPIRTKPTIIIVFSRRTYQYRPTCKNGFFTSYASVALPTNKPIPGVTTLFTFHLITFV